MFLEQLFPVGQALRVSSIVHVIVQRIMPVDDVDFVRIKSSQPFVHPGTDGVEIKDTSLANLGHVSANIEEGWVRARNPSDAKRFREVVIVLMEWKIGGEGCVHLGLPMVPDRFEKGAVKLERLAKVRFLKRLRCS